MGRDPVNDAWIGDPPDEAYGRVTDPGRYAPLHAAAHELLAQLERRFNVTRETFNEPDQHGVGPAVGVRLIPADASAGRLAIVFDAFPGLIVRMGSGDWMHEPVCGCDACAETVEECTGRLRVQLDALVAGSFGERLVLAAGWWHESWYLDERGEMATGRSLVDGSRLAELQAAMPEGELAYSAWPARG
ncbi:MAG: DUF6226 family protein [Geodermatophilaceae bacterium]